MSILNNFRLDGKVAVVTGGGRGIGAACAKAFAEAGASASDQDRACAIGQGDSAAAEFQADVRSSNADVVTLLGESEVASELLPQHIDSDVGASEFGEWCCFGAGWHEQHNIGVTASDWEDHVDRSAGVVEANSCGARE